MSHLHKIVFAFCALLQGSLYAAQVQQKSQKQLNEMYATAQKLGYFNLWEEKNLPKIKEFLANHGAEIVNFGHPESGATLLIHATNVSWSLAGFKEILALPHVSVNKGKSHASDDDGWEIYAQTALMYAANRLQFEKVKVLLDHNANTTLKSLAGMSKISLYDALHYALWALPQSSNNPGHDAWAMVDLLLSAGMRLDESHLIAAIKNDVAIQHLITRGAPITSKALDAAADKPEIYKLLSDALKVQLKNNNNSLALKTLSLQAIAQTMSKEAQQAYTSYKQVSHTENDQVAAFANHVFSLQKIIADAQKSLAEISSNSYTNAAPKGETNDDFVMID